MKTPQPDKPVGTLWPFASVSDFLEYAGGTSKLKGHARADEKAIHRP